MFWTIFPFILSSLLLGAHFLFHGYSLFMLFALAFPFLLFIKKPGTLIASQIFLYLGAIEWILTTYSLAQERIASGDDWLRMVIILGTVTAFTIFSGILLNRKTIKAEYSGIPAVSES